MLDGRALFFRRHRHIELFADFAHKMWVNFTMPGHRTSKALDRVQEPGMVTPFTHNDAAVPF
jgi:hypothetical protein